MEMPGRCSPDKPRKTWRLNVEDNLSALGIEEAEAVDSMIGSL